MACVLISVVLVMVVQFGHVGSYVINRTSTDFEHTILDYYGSPRLSDNQASHKNMAIKHHHDPASTPTENKDVDKLTPQDDLDISVLNSIWGAPPLTAENRDDQKVNEFGEKDKINIYKDTPSAESFILKTDMMKLFEKPNIPSESMTAMESPETNNTGPSFNADDRFLSETLVRTNWLGNVEVKTTSTETPKNANTTQHDLATQAEPPSISTKEPADTVILRHAIIFRDISPATEKPNVRTVEDIKPSPEQKTISNTAALSEKNASNKLDPTSRYIVLIVACLCILNNIIFK